MIKLSTREELQKSESIDFSASKSYFRKCGKTDINELLCKLLPPETTLRQLDDLACEIHSIIFQAYEKEELRRIDLAQSGLERISQHIIDEEGIKPFRDIVYEEHMSLVNAAKCKKEHANSAEDVEDDQSNYVKW